jgi:hypothetical protein
MEPAMRPFQELRTEYECLAMAIEMETRAEHSPSPRQRTDFLYLAKGWRSLVRQAAWQDASAV